MATINGKTILLNETIRFSAGQQVEFTGPFPLRVTADATLPLNTSLQVVNGQFELGLHGYSVSVHDQITSGTGVFHGQNFEYHIHAQFIASVGLKDVYEVGITVFAV